MIENTNDSTDINNPNDKFFKGALALLIVAKPMIIEFTPKDVLDTLDLDTLVLDPNSYINDGLKEHFSDIVWSCALKNSQTKRKIAFLFEHKSYKPHYPHFQINDYQRGAWKMQIDAEQQPIPIVPIVFYHGSEKWDYESFDSYFGNVEPTMLRFLPCFDYILVNMQNFSDEKIKKIESIYLQKVLLSFKHYLDKNYLALHIVELLFSGFEAKKDIQIRSFMNRIAVYLSAITGMTRHEVIELAIQSDNNLKDEAMSIFEEIYEEGIEKGIEKAIINLYKKGMTAETISNYMEYPISDVKQIIADYLINLKK